MPTIVGVKFSNSGNTGKIYYFDPLNIDFAENDGVILETVHGVEFARIVIPNKQVEESEIVSPLKPVQRKASQEDEKRFAEMQKRQESALFEGEKIVESQKLNMKLTDAQYTFDGKKLLFFFTAPDRVDFRELVKLLASKFKTRIELRQISERDDIKIRGALAPCGRPCCCTTFLPDFEKVTLKMAKVQNLSLNPAKISGMCGKLMCCLKYEAAYYTEQSKKMPPLGATVTTADGEGIAVYEDLLSGKIKVRFTGEDGDSEKEYLVDDITFTPPKKCPNNK